MADIHITPLVDKSSNIHLILTKNAQKQSIGLHPSIPAPCYWLKLFMAYDVVFVYHYKNQFYDNNLKLGVKCQGYINILFGIST